MRLTQISSLLLSFLSILITFPLDTSASPLNLFVPRQCDIPCGWNSQYCCNSGQACVTVAGIASCTAQAAPAYETASGQWQWFTTTYVETDLVTVTTTYSAFIAATTVYSPPVQTQVVTTVVPPAPTPSCATGEGQILCGTICCAAGQFCASANYCLAQGGTSTPGNVATVYYTPITSALSTASAFIRPTSATTETLTETGTATTTVPFQTPVGTDGSSLTGVTATQTNNGLSGGAIAGIVIGVLLAIFLLFLLCACCLGKAVIDTCLSIFGLGRNNRRRVTDTTIIEEHHSRHSGRVNNTGRTWFGRTDGGPARPQQNKSSGWGGALGVGAALAALAVVLGIKRRRDEERKTEYTGSSYYSDYTSESELSKFFQRKSVH
jgi:hypothetical protein